MLKSTNATVVVMMVAFIVSSVAPSLENCGKTWVEHTMSAWKFQGCF